MLLLLSSAWQLLSRRLGWKDCCCLWLLRDLVTSWWQSQGCCSVAAAMGAECLLHLTSAESAPEVRQ